MQDQKRELVMGIRNLESRGFRLSKTYSMQDSLEDLQFAYEHQKWVADIAEREEREKKMTSDVVKFGCEAFAFFLQQKPVQDNLTSWLTEKAEKRTLKDTESIPLPVQNNQENLLRRLLEECSICREEIDMKELEILDCTHYFHKNCLQQWKEKSKTCPTCRVDLK